VTEKNLSHRLVLACNDPRRIEGLTAAQLVHLPGMHAETHLHLMDRGAFRLPASPFKDVIS
jgi:hypothetical protein